MSTPSKHLPVLVLFTCISLFSLAQKTDAPYSLRVDLLRNPAQSYDHGQKAEVNSRFPSFSWATNASKQQAYQILVSTSKTPLTQDNGNIWNSGRQENTNSIAVTYKGPALHPSTAYYWKVRTWANGHPSPYSQVQTFSTGKAKDMQDFALPSFALVKREQTPTTITHLSNSTIYDFGKDAFAQPVLTITNAKKANETNQATEPNAAKSHDTLTLHLGEALDPTGHIDRHPPGSVRYRIIKTPLIPGRHTYTPTIQPDTRNTAKSAIHMPADIGEVLPFRYVEIDSLPANASIEGLHKGSTTNSLPENASHASTNASLDSTGAPIVTPSISIDSISRYIVTRDFDDTSTTFTSSDTTLNKIWELCKYTTKATSFSGYYVDGDRERIPYEADALITQLSDYASDADYTMAGRTLDYLIDHPTWPTEWSLQNILIAWYDYLYTGDIRLAKRLYPDLKAKLLSSLARQDGLISTRTNKQTPDFLKSIHFETFNTSTELRDIVDWPPPDFNGPNSKGETDGFVFTDYNAVVNAFYYYDLTIMAKLAKALDNPADAKQYNTQAHKVRAAYERTFLDPKTNLVIDGEGTTHSSLHANFFALAFDLIPKKIQPDVLAFIHSRGMACSVYGAQFLLDALANANDQDYALQLITSKEKRSWTNMIREGATMTMEAWGQEYKGNQDWSHAWGSAPANYIVRQFAGIQPLKPGFAEIQIKPHPGHLTSATLKYQTIRGQIEEHFENRPNYFRLEITLPGNTLTRVYLPTSLISTTSPTDPTSITSPTDTIHPSSPPSSSDPATSTSKTDSHINNSQGLIAKKDSHSINKYGNVSKPEDQRLIVKMDGHLIKSRIINLHYQAGYIELQGIPPGPHSFEVYPAHYAQ